MRYSDISDAITGYPLFKVVVFDTETTGVSSDDEVLSIAVCDGYGNELFRSYVRPTRHKRWPEAQRINGITPKHVAKAPTMRELAGKLQDLLLGDKLLVGYNVSFDIGFLLRARVLGEYPNATFDVMREYATVHGKNRWEHGGYKWSKLADCAKHYGYRFTAHDALADAKATSYCFRSLLVDQGYLDKRISQMVGALGDFDMKQTNTTSANIAKLVPGSHVKEQAVLRLGQITRGKNKGEPRYECFVGDNCVGVQNYGDAEVVRRLFCIEGSKSLPSEVPCLASLSMRGSAPSCHVSITGNTPLEDELREMACNERASLALIRDTSGEDSPVQFIEDETSTATPDYPNAIANAPTAKKAGCVSPIIICFLVFLGIGAFSSGDVIPAIVIWAVAAFLGYRKWRRDA